LYKEEEVNKKLIDKEVKKAKFRLLKPLSKAHNIMVYIRSLGGCIVWSSLGSW
jgi:hypothetical protein